MRLHLIHHDPVASSGTNISRWVQNKGYAIAHSYLCNNEALPIAGIQFHPEYPLESVKYFVREFGDEMQKGPYVAGKEKILSQTDQIPETYTLMATILDNMERQFKVKN